jgi:phage recombination protein Bet
MSSTAQHETGRPAGAPVVTVDAPNASQLDPALTSSSSTAIAPIHGKLAQHASDERAPIVTFDAERIRILKETIMPGASDSELDFFMIVCRRTGLDPFARQIHAVKRIVSEKVVNERGREQWVKKDKWVYQVAIDGFRLIAERTGKYRGQEVPLYCGEDGVWREVWFSKTPPAASKVGVLRKDFDSPLYGVAMFDEYAQKTDVWEDGERTGVQRLNAMWGSKPCVMISKVAEALALRKAFPQEMAGLYSDDEMAAADNPGATSDASDPGAQRRKESGKRAGDSARGGGAPAAAAASTSSGPGDARTNANANWVNGSRMVFPYNRGPRKYKEWGVTLDATYVVGATRVKKGKDGAPDETIECGGQFVIADAVLEEALGWVDGKLRKHNDASERGELHDEAILTNEDVEKLLGWQNELLAEIEARDERAALQSENEGKQGPGPTAGGSAQQTPSDSTVTSSTRSTSTTSTASSDSEGARPSTSTASSPATAIDDSGSSAGKATSRTSTGEPLSIRNATPGSPAAQSLEERARVSGGDDARASMTADGDEHAPDPASEKAGLKKAIAKRSPSSGRFMRDGHGSGGALDAGDSTYEKHHPGGLTDFDGEQ